MAKGGGRKGNRPSTQALRSRISNRQIRILEPLVSHRKQRTAPPSNRQNLRFRIRTFSHPDPGASLSAPEPPCL